MTVLARILFEELERLDPSPTSGENEFCELSAAWDGLGERGRSVYYLAIAKVLSHRTEVLLALDATSDYVISRALD